MIRNPILPGFNPDPSICRVGEDYYIATSTFEWYPGVQIHHSRDLANWTLATRPLTRAAQLDMRGNPDSCGIWAPCLSFADGLFWLVYTDVKRLDGAFKDAHNYVVTAPAIEGPWSDPIYVNSSGFDPSLFHDADGSKYFMNVRWNHRGKGTGGNPAHASFDGILLQEWSPDAGLTGPVRNIFDGTARGLTEAPHIFARDGWYYLTTAEGGTGYDHAVTTARARDIWGPYEVQPGDHLMTGRDAPDHPVQRSGHGQYVEAPDGTGYHTFLMGRPLPGRFCPMGRETGIERVVWQDGWPVLEAGGTLPRSAVPHHSSTQASEPITYDLNAPTLHPDFQWLRTPDSDRIFAATPLGLTLIGRESIGSWFEQGLVARRQEHAAYSASTLMSFDPVTYQQAAGLTTYYNRSKFHALMVSHDPTLGRVLTILSCPGDWPEGALTHPVTPVPLNDGPVALRVDVDHETQQFYWRQTGAWTPIGPALDASAISDEGGRGEHASFTGAFVGMAAFDTSGGARRATFTQFTYAGHDV
ncbi:glycoside hydrolase family 43 protein [uncultured Tateyamaria sp.]|uniref:glycoside hydrolase family 43 protein n=1 Tax=uncultured Tateyamaria sp. TaxID=455651 RepID=UPI0026149C72|nr:glycoside hydrolase family 43 protein [uncultured Tateyamaria sp.]